MKYSDYVKDTYYNCLRVLSECSYDELFDLEHIKRLLIEDDRVTGILSGHCSSTCQNNQVGEIFRDEEFIVASRSCNIDAINLASLEPEVIDVIVRCVILSQINIYELTELEMLKRSKPDH